MQYVVFIRRKLCSIISKHGIMADTDKVKVIRSMATPTNVRDVRSFTGIFSYFK